MISSIYPALFFVTIVTFSFKTCKSDLQPSLHLYSFSEPEYSEVIVRRVGDNLTLECRLQGDEAHRVHVWNYVAHNGTKEERPFEITPEGPSTSSNLTKRDLRESDSGHYMCSAPPFSVTKYVLVQGKGPSHCARAAFWCGARCVLPAYVCDGHADCARGEDEAPELCRDAPCQRSDKLNCTGGRCIPARACAACDARALCLQPACCALHVGSRDGYMDAEYPPLFEDRRAPDEYGFIQSTIYTVTACALIFMIAVVLLVSAICKMHMKRAALRSYVPPDQYGARFAQLQTHRFPPCYEASRLLEQQREAGGETQLSPESPTEPEGPPPPPEAEGGFGLARLSAIFTNRYRQVPTQCCDVEMTDVRASSLTTSPTRSPTRSPARLDNCRSPTFCDLNADFYFTNPEASDCGRDLNYMATPVEFYRRRTLRSNVVEQRPLTLQLGRFQLNIPRFGRRSSNDRRPDTPNVAEVSIEDLDFVRFNSNDTYTLNGRTIRLLGANFENYPVLPDGSVRPPPYNEAMRYKLYGPPPEYLSRDCLDRSNVDQQARCNIEMPPEYNELATGSDNTNNNNDNATALPVTNNDNIDNHYEVNTENSDVVINHNDNGDNHNDVYNVMENNNNDVMETINSVIDNLPAIDSDLNFNETENVSC